MGLWGPVTGLAVAAGKQRRARLVVPACAAPAVAHAPSACPSDSLQGTAAYAPEKAALVWKIKNFPGGQEFLLRCKFGLPSVAAEEEAQGRLPPIKVKFEVRLQGWWQGLQCLRGGGRGC